MIPDDYSSEETETPLCQFSNCTFQEERGRKTEKRGRSRYCFSGAVGADDEGQGLEESDDVLVLGVEAPNPLDEHFVHRAHLSPSLPVSSCYSPKLMKAAVIQQTEERAVSETGARTVRNTKREELSLPQYSPEGKWKDGRKARVRKYIF